jgi:hypothetical protein
MRLGSSNMPVSQTVTWELDGTGGVSPASSGVAITPPAEGKEKLTPPCGWTGAPATSRVVAGVLYYADRNLE